MMFTGNRFVPKAEIFNFMSLPLYIHSFMILRTLLGIMPPTSTLLIELFLKPLISLDMVYIPYRSYCPS